MNPWKNWKHFVKPSWCRGNYNDLLLKSGFQKEMCAFIFDDIRLGQFSYLDKLKNPEIFGLQIDQDVNISLHMRYLSTLCHFSLYEVTNVDLNMLLIALKFKHIKPCDFEFIVAHHTIQSKLTVSYVGFLYGRGIDITLSIIKNLSCVLISPMTSDLISQFELNLEFHDTNETLLIKDITYHIKTYGFQIDDTCVFGKNRNSSQFIKSHPIFFSSLLSVIPLNEDQWFSWLTSSSQPILIFLLNMFPNFKLTENQKITLLKYVIINQMFDTITVLPLPTTCIEWIDIIELCGQDKSKHLKKLICNKSNDFLKQVKINFDYVLPPKKEVWMWIGFGTLLQGTYRIK